MKYDRNLAESEFMPFHCWDMAPADHDHVLDQIAMEGLTETQKKVLLLLAFGAGIATAQIGQFVGIEPSFFCCRPVGRIMIGR